MAGNLQHKTWFSISSTVFKQAFHKLRKFPENTNIPFLPRYMKLHMTAIHFHLIGIILEFAQLFVSKARFLPTGWLWTSTWFEGPYAGPNYPSSTKCQNKHKVNFKINANCQYWENLDGKISPTFKKNLSFHLA